MSKLKKGDTVEVIKGEDTGKKGRIIQVFPERNRALVEGINIAKKATRPNRQDQQGGIKSVEMPISIANLMFFCKHCNRAVRIGFTTLKDGTKSRICKDCKEVI